MIVVLRLVGFQVSLLIGICCYLMSEGLVDVVQLYFSFSPVNCFPGLFCKSSGVLEEP